MTNPDAGKRLTAVVATAFALWMTAGAASALSEEGRGTEEQRRACTPDVFKHCAQFIPNADRITLCLRQKIRDLSPECRVVMIGSKRP